MTALEFPPKSTRADIEHLRRSVSLPDTAAGFGVALQEDGNEWVALCPFHIEDTPSFTVFTGRDNVQRYHCFGCGEHGDVLDFVQAIKGVDLPETIRILGGGEAGPNIAPRKVEVRDIYAGIVPLDPPGEIEPRQRVKLYNPKRAGTEREWGSFAPSMIFPYRRADGALLGYVLRHELPDGGKETPMVMWVRLPDGKECWSRFPFPKPRPLYGLETIGNARQVIVVEGEKCRDALAEATGRTVISWPGGTQGVKHAGWTPLAGRNIVIWPDADGPGLSTAQEIAGIVSQLGCTTRVMKLPAGDRSDGPYSVAEWQDGKAPPNGWDVADAVRDGWVRDDIDAFMRGTAEPWTPPEKPAKKLDVTPTPPAGPPMTEAQPARVEKRVEPPQKPSAPIAGLTQAPKLRRLVEEPASELCTMQPRRERQKAGVSLADFHAYMPNHNFIFAPSGEFWPAVSVNARISPIPVLDEHGNQKQDEKGKPVFIPASAWLDRNSPVEQITWAPGEPEIVRDRLISDGGWIDRPGCACFNLYRPPVLKSGDAAMAARWVDHVRRVYRAEADHIIHWLAHRVQRPHEKINHALVLGGSPGIGKDTLLEPVKGAIGSWNFAEVSPQHMLGRFNGFVKSVILRVSEARDLGDMDRFAFYDHMKTYTAAPPDVLRVDEKHLREYSVFNVCGVIITTNYKADGIYLPADDRRHFVAWSDAVRDDFAPEYWTELYRWYDSGGVGHVAAYLRQLDLSGFNAKAPPEKTPAFWAIADANRAPEDAELADALDALGNPRAITLLTVISRAEGTFLDWLQDRKNRRKIPHRLEAAGYVPVRNPDAADGLWKIGRKRQTVYAQKTLPLRDQIAAAYEVAGQ